LDTSIKKGNNTVVSKFKSNTNIPMITNEESIKRQPSARFLSYLNNEIKAGISMS
jgi:hypothetical protein